MGNFSRDPRDLRKALRLYVIPDRVVGAPLSLEEQTRLALEGGATAIQLRDKSMDGGELLETAARMAALCAEHGALFIVNDRLDVALLSGADGVHLGQSDLPVNEARKLAPRPFVVGTSAHRASQAEKAERDGADYLGGGAVFETGSKDDAAVIGLQGLRELTGASRLPVVAIGGISLENLPEVMRSGVDGVSVISAAVRGDVKERVAALRRVLNPIFTI
ncbi:MAG: thiamine phosphate synthase [Synergistaceae bacterium]|jgi:thiamine-phosphate pyrophosphorylase|nr:thiamine phosphate synthase [Synergistaceae bacterium]